MSRRTRPAVEGAATRSGRGGRSGGESLRRLEEEGEVAADYLEELLDIADLDGDIDIDVENGRASVAIVAEAGADRELRRLVGPTRRGARGAAGAVAAGGAGADRGPQPPDARRRGVPCGSAADAGGHGRADLPGRASHRASQSGWSR